MFGWIQVGPQDGPANAGGLFDRQDILGGDDPPALVDPAPDGRLRDTADARQLGLVIVEGRKCGMEALSAHARYI